jgi:acyl transferase domain-containing protein
VHAALATAQAAPHAVGLVSMHGTGTPLGDPIEVNALGQALASPAPHAVALGEPLKISLAVSDAHRIICS